MNIDQTAQAMFQRMALAGREKAKHSIRKVGSTPWQAVFTAYCAGATNAEISQMFEIPQSKLENRMNTEQWVSLRATVIRAETRLPATVEKRLALVAENRVRNAGVFTDLQQHVIETAKALRDGTLKIKRTVRLDHKKGGGTVTVEEAPSPSDWLTIASYARVVADATYRALGDFTPTAGRQQAIGDGAPMQIGAPSITIILPPAIAAPRGQRDVTPRVHVEADVIDLTEVTVSQAPLRTLTEGQPQAPPSV